MDSHPKDAPKLIAAQALVVRRTAGGSSAYELLDREGLRLGTVQQVEIPSAEPVRGKVAKFLEWASDMPTVRLDVMDGASGSTLFTTTLSAETHHRRASVRNGDGTELGEVLKAKGLRKIHFDLKADGVALGTVDAEGWSGFDYRIDEGGTPVGRITMLGGDTVLAIPTTSDDFLLDLDRPLAEPLRTLVLACAVAMDVSVRSRD